MRQMKSKPFETKDKYMLQKSSFIHIIAPEGNGPIRKSQNVRPIFNLD